MKHKGGFQRQRAGGNFGIHGIKDSKTSSDTGAPNLCMQHVKFLLQMDTDCQRANCQYVHYNKRLAKVRLVDFKQLINASSINASAKAEICDFVDKNPKRFKK
jgi:hypothetical protein